MRRVIVTSHPLLVPVMKWQERRPRPGTYLAVHDAVLNAYETGDWESGLPALTAGRSHFPSDPQLLLFESNRLAAMGSEHLAEAALERIESAVRHNPLFLEARFRRAGLLWRLGYHKDALCAARAIARSLEATSTIVINDVLPAAEPTKRWSPAHPSHSRAAARREVHRMLTVFERTLPGDLHSRPHSAPVESDGHECDSHSLEVSAPEQSSSGLAGSAEGGTVD